MNGKKFFICGILFLFFSSTSLPGDEGSSFFLTIAQKGNDGVLSFPEKDHYKIIKGNRVRFFFMPLKNSYIYLFYSNPRDESPEGFQLLFPADFNLFEQNHYYLEKYFLPGRDKWFNISALSDSGERFYLIAAPRRLKKLEALFSNYKSGKGSARYEAINEISHLIQLYHAFTRDFTPVMPFTGILRGSPDKIEEMAVLIRNEKIYVRQIQIVDN